MAIDSVSAISPIMAAAPLTTLSRPPETTPDARETAAQENDSRRTAEAVSGASPAHLAGPEETSASTSVGTRENIVAAPSDTEGSLREAASQIAQLSTSDETTSTQIRIASAAYQAEASARSDIAQQREGNGARSVDVLA